MEQYEAETFNNSSLSNLTPTQVHSLDAIFHLEDRRFFSIHLTSKGKELAKLHDEIHKSYADLFKQVLDEKELKTLETLLSKVLKEI